MKELRDFQKRLVEFVEHEADSENWPELPENLWGKPEEYYLRLAMSLLDQGGLGRSDLRSVWRYVSRYL